MAASRDYYADLELPRDADINDIKKQFRKLALKYHPDRNPGREQEVNAKFQIIQAAHEILSDPTEKAKHDSSFGRGRYSGASGVRGNPWANAGAQFPTPPRRTNAAAGAARNTQNNFKNAQSGAQRWQSRFSSGVPPTAKQRFGSDDPEGKKNAAKAFENMRKNAQQKKPQATEPPPPPPRQPPGTGTESARQRAEASFGSRKSGYYPRSTMTGDEPSVASHNYSKFERREVPPPPPERPGPNPMPDPLSQFRERNDTSSSTKPTQTDVAGDQQRRSANGDTGPYTTGSVHSHSKARSDSDHVKMGTTQTTKTTTTTTTTPTAKTKSSNSEDGPSMYANLYTQTFSMSQYLFEIYKLELNPSKSSFKHRLAATELESSRNIGQDQSPSGTSCDSVASITFERKQTTILNKLIDSKDQLLQPPHKSALGLSMSTNKKNMSQHEALTNQGQNYSFSFPIDDETFRQSGRTRSGGYGFAKSSVDDITTSFANDEGSKTWQFNAGTADAEANVGHDWSSPCAGRNRQSHMTRPTMSRGDDSTNTASNGSQVESGFNAEGWSDKFGPQIFVPHPVPGPSVSPSRSGRTNSKRSKVKTASETAAAPSASVAESSSDDESYDWRGRQAQTRSVATATDSPQAMDIDTPPAEARRGQAARNIHVEPSRAEWRAGNVDGATSSDEMPQRPAKIPLYVNAVGSEDTEEFRATLADLKNVAPFLHDKLGLDSLSGLKEHLPFESKASDVPPVELPRHATPLAFPQPPTAPRFLHPPVAAVDGISKPTTLSWNKYLADFEEYLRQWDTFNGQVVDHFSTRKALVSNTRAVKGYSFLGARGDADMDEYYNWVQQDNDVRGRWMDACTEHQNRLRELMALRKQMKKRG
ncbi:hypothetical protein E4U21_004565 [Claviceps maximensis]|nr:hypothetical protein E4U21_004565 [Claviceps maximensis]